MFVLGLIVAIVATLGTTASAAIIEYRATDLANVAPGDDLWRYEYFVSGVAFVADQGFSVYFGPALYASLGHAPASPDPDWDVITVQPDSVLPSDGFYDAFALANAPSLVAPFVLTFHWQGGPGAQPGSQAFTINQFDAQGLATVLDSGRTVPLRVPGVPEPSSALLVGVGIALALQRYRRRP
jgi:hypothetical protein